MELPVIEPPPAAALAADPWLEALEHSTDCAYCRSPAGRILAANPSFARRFCHSGGEIVGCEVAQFVHPDDQPMLVAAMHQMERSPHRATHQHRWLTRHGVRWFEWEESAVCDGDGAVRQIRAVGRDITRQRLIEEQYYRFSLAVEQSPVSIVITDLGGRAQYVNSRFTAVTGLTLEDILDRQIEVLRAGHATAESFAKFMGTVRSGQSWQGELATVTQHGSTIWESVKVSCLRNPNGEITQLLCLREDISERKQLELQLRQAQKMESLGTMAGGIAHDFNNLLAIINGYAELCQQGPPESALMQRGLREIHRAAQRASGLVRQILTFSRKTEMKLAPTDLNQLARDLVALLAETFPRTITFHCSLPPELPLLLCDQNQLQQILLNFCVNARDAMPQGGTIALSTGLTSGSELTHLGGDPARMYAHLAVSDTGVGMEPEVRARIFEPFFTTKPVNHGTGLGLAVVYGIVVAHQGLIDVESTPGAGSTFRVFLPLPDSTVKAPVAAKADDWLPEGSESLLVVDDEVALRTLLAKALGWRGYQVTTAGTGLEAISLIRSTVKFDAVLLDLNLPGACGADVLKSIRHCRPELAVLVLSGHMTPAARIEFEQTGRRDFLQKPFRLQDVGRRLRSLLETSARAGAPGPVAN